MNAIIKAATRARATVVTMATLGATRVWADTAPAQCSDPTSGGLGSGVACAGPPSQASGNLADLFHTVANTLLFIVGAIAVIMLIVGGLRYVMSGGNSSGVEGAKNTIMYSIIGIAVAASALLIVNFVLSRLGVQ